MGLHRCSPGASREATSAATESCICCGVWCVGGRFVNPHLSIDVSPVEYIGIAINGGYNGMDERKKYYAIARQVLVQPPG